MSYPNLSEAVIERSTTFFNQLDTDNDGLIKIEDISQACDAFTSKHPSYKPAKSPFVPSIFMAENLTLESPICSETYQSLQEKYPELCGSYNEIDTNSSGNIACCDLITFYEPQPTVIESSSCSHYWIEYIKEHENLTDTSTITLEQFLTFQNDYNFTRYFPLIDE